MERHLTEILKEKGICCISGKPLSTSKFINLVNLDFEPDWEFPYHTNILSLEHPRRAIAAIHDDEVIPGKRYLEGPKVKFAIEIQDEEIIYHPVESLKQIRYVEEN